MYFTGNGGYQFFVFVFALMLNSLTLDISNKVTNWILTGVLPEKNEPFDTSLALIMSNLANGKLNPKFNNSV